MFFNFTKGTKFMSVAVVAHKAGARVFIDVCDDATEEYITTFDDILPTFDRARTLARGFARRAKIEGWAKA